MATVTTFRCAHCHALLNVDEDGQPVPCVVHPDGCVTHTDEEV